MYTGFNIEVADEFKEFEGKGLEVFVDFKEKVERGINSYISKSGTIDGTMMQSDWFPQINADIFISHSHKDQNKAIMFAGWLKKRFGLTAFIDSLVWGYANDLLRDIDDEYCLNPTKTMYDYNKRNETTSHVHSMLSTALVMMIDKTECLMFLNTPSSIQISDAVEKTKSPWIYFEIGISKYIDRKIRRKPELLKKGQFEAKNESLDIEYRLPTEGLVNLCYEDLRMWETLKNFNVDQHPLDVLYKQKGITPEVLLG